MSRSFWTGRAPNILLISVPFFAAPGLDLDLTLKTKRLIKFIVGIHSGHIVGRAPILAPTGSQTSLITSLRTRPPGPQKVIPGGGRKVPPDLITRNNCQALLASFDPRVCAWGGYTKKNALDIQIWAEFKNLTEYSGHYLLFGKNNQTFKSL